MDIVLSEIDGICVCAVIGDIDLYSAQELHKKWLFHASKGKAQPFIFDFLETAYLDSSGIGVLIQILADAKTKGIPFCLCNVRGMAEKLLHLGRMDAILPIEKGKQEALTKMRSVQK
jgi:anti-anti-sigma factor